MGYLFQVSAGIWKGSLHSKRFHASSSRKLGREQKKEGMRGKGEGSSRSRSNFRAITQLEMLATQANERVGILLVKVFQKLGKSVISRKSPKG